MATVSSSSSASGSPRLSPRTDSSSSKVDAAAKTRIHSLFSPTSTPLKGSEPLKDPKVEKQQEDYQLLYQKACQLLQDQSSEGARSTFFALLESFGSDESHWIDSADCHIGIARSYPQDSVERNDAVIKAKESLDAALKHTLKNVLDDDSIQAFQIMTNLYKEISDLAPPDQTAFHKDVKAKIDNCLRQVFYGKLDQAHKLRKQNQLDQARDVLLPVMPTISGNDKAEFILAQAQGNALIASTCSLEETRHQYSSDARDQAFEAYERKEELLKNREPARVYDAFDRLFSSLKRLIPDNAQIKEKLAECRRLASFESTMGTDGKDSKVTKDPARPLSPPSARLRGSEPSKNPEVEKYNQARQLLEKGKTVDARSLFLQLITTFGNDESHLIESAECHLWVALSHLPNSLERKGNTFKAKELLDAAFAKNSKGDASDKAAIHAFQKMRVAYQNCTIMVPEEHAEFHEAVKAKIEECSHRIPVLSTFQEKLREAKDLIKQNQLEQASQLLLEALPSISDNDKAEFILARAQANMWIAWSLPPGELSRDSHLTEAKNQAFAAYNQIDELLKIKGLERVYYVFASLFSHLDRLIPDNAQIQEKLEESRRKYESLEIRPDHAEGKKDRKVTEEPVGDYWKPFRIFIAFGIAAAVIVGAIVLGRRLITKLN